MKIELSDKEVETLRDILRVDMDALGLPRKYQRHVAAVLKKLSAAVRKE